MLGTLKLATYTVAGSFLVQPSTFTNARRPMIHQYELSSVSDLGSCRVVLCLAVWLRFVPCRLFRFLSFRAVVLRQFVPFGVVSSRDVSFRFVPFRSVSCRSVSFRVVCSHRVFFVRFGRDSVVDASDVDRVRLAPRRRPVSFEIALSKRVR